MKGAYLHPKIHSIQLFIDASNKGWDAHVEQVSTKGLWSDRKKRTTHKCSRVEGGFSGSSKVQGPVSKQIVAVAADNLTVAAYINRQGGTHSGKMCALLWKIMTWCHHYKITLRARHLPKPPPLVSKCDDRPSVQSTECSLHLQVFQ